VCAFLTVLRGKLKNDAAFVFSCEPNGREIPDLTGLATVIGIRLVDRSCSVYSVSGNTPITSVGLRDYRKRERGEVRCVYEFGSATRC
jgi:hypothetical protein